MTDRQVTAKELSEAVETLEQASHLNSMIAMTALTVAAAVMDSLSVLVALAGRSNIESMPETADTVNKMVSLVKQRTESANIGVRLAVTTSLDAFSKYNTGDKP